MTALAWIGVMFIIAVILRAKINFLGRSLVPACVIAGQKGTEHHFRSLLYCLSYRSFSAPETCHGQKDRLRGNDPGPLKSIPAYGLFFSSFGILRRKIIKTRGGSYV